MSCIDRIFIAPTTQQDFRYSDPDTMVIYATTTGLTYNDQHLENVDLTEDWYEMFVGKRKKDTPYKIVCQNFTGPLTFTNFSKVFKYFQVMVHGYKETRVESTYDRERKANDLRVDIIRSTIRNINNDNTINIYIKPAEKGDYYIRVKRTDLGYIIISAVCKVGILTNKYFLGCTPTPDACYEFLEQLRKVPYDDEEVPLTESFSSKLKKQRCEIYLLQKQITDAEIIPAL